ncbi:MAG: Holliday junction resolvase RuvX [Cyanobacteria bacterium P01_H01_bin.121]
MMRRIAALGLDVGRKRVGVAGCDGTGLIATGIMTLYRSSFDADIATLQKLIADRQIEILVVGLPYTMAGELGYQAKQVQKYAERLSQALALPLAYVDERLTSIEAKNLIQAGKRARRHDKGLVDRKAAAIILQQWLDEQRAHNFSDLDRC